MSQVSNSDIYNLLINMRGDMGRLEGKMDGQANVLETQKADHDRLVAEVQRLQLSAAKQKGFVAALSAVGGVVGTGLGLAAEYFFKGH